MQRNAVALAAALAALAAADAPKVARQEVKPAARPADPTLPAIFRLDAAPFVAESEPTAPLGAVQVAKVRFPSPMTTEHPANNTVHAEWFKPVGAKGPVPCVLVLHIAGGDFPLSRAIAGHMADHGFSALFVALPYYGDRRPPGGKVRMLSTDLQRGLGSMRQAVLDLRRACDWIAAQPEHDGRVGIFGVSLGGIVGGLASAIEPRISHACLVMAGANLEHILFDSSERDAKQFRAAWEKAGGTRDSFRATIAECDAGRYGHRLKDRVVLMVSARDDTTVPRACTTALWEAAGKQRNVWYPCGHYTMAWYFAPAMRHAVEFFREWRPRPFPPQEPGL